MMLLLGAAIASACRGRCSRSRWSARPCSCHLCGAVPGGVHLDVGADDQPARPGPRDGRRLRDLPAVLGFVTFINNPAQQRQRAAKPASGPAALGAALDATRRAGSAAGLRGSRRIRPGRPGRADRLVALGAGLVVVVGGAAQEPDHGVVDDRGVGAGRPRAREHARRRSGSRGTMRVVAGPGPAAGLAGSDAPDALADAGRADRRLAVHGGPRAGRRLRGRGVGAVCAARRPANQYGVEGSGLWLHLQTITDRVRARGEVLGHASPRCVPGTVIVLVAVAVQAVVRDDSDKIPAALGSVPRRRCSARSPRPATCRPRCRTPSRRAASRCSPPAFPGRRAGPSPATSA